MSTEATPETPPPSKPHFLRRVQIRNYKSIAFCDVTLEPLTILVGRNATGKSNFLDALGFLRDVVVKGVREAVHLHGGRDAVLCRSAKSNSIRLEIDCIYNVQGDSNEWRAKYAIEIGLPSISSPRLISEVIRLSNSVSGQFSEYSVEGGQVSWKGNCKMIQLIQWYNTDKTLLQMYWDPPFGDFLRLLETVVFYDVYPDSMRVPQLPSSESFLKPDGSNLASVYNSTMAADPAAAKRAARYLNAVARSVEFAGVLSAGGYEIMEFDTSGNVDFWNGPDRKPDRFPAASMSDGTLRAFAACMAAFQTIAPYGSPSLVAIEEPETALHPAAMRALVAALDEATWRTQILITTHSPDLLDAEEVKPANVRVVELVEGHTVIGPMDISNVEIIKQEWSTVGGLERDHQLQPDLDDQDRQAELAGRERAHS